MNTEWYEEIDDTGESPMSRVLKSGHPAAGILMVLMTDSANAADDEPAIHRAARNSEVRVVRELIEQGADPDEMNSEGFTPMFWASMTGCADLAKLLINRGGDVNAIDTMQTGLSVLALAKLMGYHEIAGLLTSAGARY